MSPELDRIASRAKADRKMRFTALAHHLTEEFLRETWQGGRDAKLWALLVKPVTKTEGKWE
jgi:hypothetical protein